MKPCTQCGRCCQNPDFMMRLGVSTEDTERWQREGRDDILAWVDRGNVWINPTTREGETVCPFVRKAEGHELWDCTIHDTRPETCRAYPFHVAHMKFVDCEMLDEGDTDADVERFMAAAT